MSPKGTVSLPWHDPPGLHQPALSHCPASSSASCVHAFYTCCPTKVTSLPGPQGLIPWGPYLPRMTGSPSCQLNWENSYSSFGTHKKVTSCGKPSLNSWGLSTQSLLSPARASGLPNLMVPVSHGTMFILISI